MYISKLAIENLRCFGAGPDRFEISLKPGLTALVGANDAGKTAIVDAIRLALGTTDLETYRLEDTDFHKGDTSREIRITCKFEDLGTQDKRAFVEYLTYGEQRDDDPVLYVNWSAKDTGEIRRGRPYRRVEVRSGRDGSGPAFASEARELLRATYLRPLRDAEQALSAGRGSRLSQVLYHTDLLRVGGEAYARGRDTDPKRLTVLGIMDFANDLLERHQAIVDARNNIDEHLKELSFRGDSLQSGIRVSGAAAADDVRLRRLLEKLDLCLGGVGRVGLGSDNVLFMACELLLLAKEDEGLSLLLIEEPEAHLHPQRQLRVMRFLQEQAKVRGIQIIVTTHSPNLASVIDLNNIVLVRNGRAFSMGEEDTKLERSDYRFLQRFLDVTRSNLFFSRGVIVVEGDAENILLPTLASLLGRDLTDYGVSVVNVGGVGLRRYARIFQRKHVDKDGPLDVPVACVTDVDIMPDCAPAIIGKVKEGEAWPAVDNRRWRAKRDIGDEAALKENRQEKHDKASGQFVKTFVTDEWTFEYNLALGPKDEHGVFHNSLAEDVFVAACLADKDEALNAEKVTTTEVEAKAAKAYEALRVAAVEQDGCTAAEVLASMVNAKFARDGVSKAVAAQYLAERLRSRRERGQLTPEILRRQLPKYIVETIDYVCGSGGDDVQGERGAH